MAYIVPRVLIDQEFSQSPVFSATPLASFVFGPQYNLNRYSVAAEKVAIDAGPYIPGAATTYSFPNQVEGTFVDASYVKVFVDNAYLQYYPVSQLTALSGAVTRVAAPNGQYYPNRIKATNLIFQTANGYSNNAFGGRDVQLGDVLTISGDSGTYVVTTSVTGLYPSYTASSTANAGGAAKGGQALNDSASVVWVGSGSAPTAPANTSSAYVGYIAAGVVNDTYTITFNGTNYTITSASGLVNRSGVALVSEILTVDNANGNDLLLDFTGAASTTGDAWTLTVAAHVVPATPTLTGTYFGPQNINYKLTVVRGGQFYDGTNAATCARVSISSNNVDGSPTVNVAQTTAFAVGSYGITAAFSTAVTGGGLILGDTYIIAATAAAADKVNIIQTADALPVDFTAGTHSDYVITAMYLVENLQVNQIISGNTNDTNFTVDTTAQTITIAEGITQANAAITVGDVEVLLALTSGELYIEHRELVVGNSISIGSVTTTDQVEAALGTVHPDNTLAQGVYDAVSNSGGVPVYYAAVATNDLSGYNGALALAKKSNAYYGLVPLSYDPAITAAVVSQVNALSTANYAKWRVAWLAAQINQSKLIYNLQSNNSIWQATVTGDPLTVGNPNTLVTVAGATFVTDGVRAGDQVLINFRVQPDGTLINDVYTVAAVRTQTTLVLVAGPSAPISVAEKVQVQRIYTSEEIVADLVAQASNFSNRRVRLVLPDVAYEGAITKSGYDVAAACAGLRSGVVPHQGLTNSPLVGFTDVSTRMSIFTEDQLNELGAAGLFIVTQDTVNGEVYVRQQLTTDVSGLNQAEDSITSNVDSISLSLMATLKPYIGTYNVNPNTVNIVRQAVASQLGYLAGQTFTIRAGNQLTSFTILSVQQDATFADRINVQVQLIVPAPLNFITITLLV